MQTKYGKSVWLSRVAEPAIKRTNWPSERESALNGDRSYPHLGIPKLSVKGQVAATNCG